MKTVLAAFLLALVCRAYPQDTSKTIERDLASKYQDKLFILRSFYRTESLHFDGNGKLISTGDTGYGPTDGSIHASSFKLKGNQLTISGDLPVPIFDAKTGNLIYTKGYIGRVVVLDIPDPIDNTSIEAALWRVFYQPGERPLPACSPERSAAFREAALRSLNRSSSQPEKANPGTSITAVACFPNGESAPRIRRGPEEPRPKITPPRATYEREPDFPEAARQKRLQGEVELTMIVDSFGRPSTIIITRPLGNGFDESAAKTVHSWRFDPAKIDGQPTPVAIFVEVSFHLYNPSSR